MSVRPVSRKTRIVPYCRPTIGERELEYLRDVVKSGCLAGNGPQTIACHDWLRDRIGCKLALLTQSCTSALELAALLLDLKPGDEVIMPSYTFVSTANAVVLRGAIPMFVDVRRDTLNIDETLIESAVSPRTKAIFVVHYAGVPCNMDPIRAIAERHGLAVVEDAAQALLSTYKERPAGALGDIGCFSFHETKNVVAGEGGALTVNEDDLVERAQVLWLKGTNRYAFDRGLVEKYTWLDVGSSFLPSELTAAFLRAQFDAADDVTNDRRETWHYYHAEFEPLETRGLARRPQIPKTVRHNGHIYYLILPSADQQLRMIASLKAEGIVAPFHYVPLHSSPAGKRFGRVHGSLPVTSSVAERLIRLPLWAGMEETAERVVATVSDCLGR